MIKLAIFDCDGTLVDSGDTIYRALKETLSAHGHDCPPREISQKVIGLSLVEAMQWLVPEGDHQRLAASYKDAFVSFRSRGEVEEPLYDGIPELLDAFEEDGWLLGVATGKSDRGLAHVLACHGWEKRFSSLHTADRHPSKPHPSMALANMADCGAEPAMTVLIGDTSHDMGTARAAGVGAIGATWGYHDHDELVGGGAHYITLRPDGVMHAARKWIGEGA
ncbi:HAD hydrolase-like protein [Sphingomicrobium lutaoense]|uniref:Phosphoglycolate phosphatase n=1 Tax=Sphingomicrobium lutaoense TaxID=515949 RepID=A0A839YV52_9SPHN|nr:HAD hydrolase-like protein [Sphingomicrobium lutaoense]MBB3763089.1 phosphoglycolate phosphatase [Sphingomicrobium lutaoense]